MIDRPDIHSMPIVEAIPLLAQWARPHLPPKLIHSHEKISDADLVAVAILRYVRKISSSETFSSSKCLESDLSCLGRFLRYSPPSLPRRREGAKNLVFMGLLLAKIRKFPNYYKMPYFNKWWDILTIDLKLPFPSLTQAHVRLKRLTPVIEKLSHKVEDIEFALIDSAPIPTCRYKRAEKCKFPGATFGYGTQGKIFGYKIHAWTSLNGKILNYTLKPANEHDFTAGCSMNDKWSDYNGPKMIGDKAYYGGGYIVPPKSNTKNPDLRWKEEFYAARKMIECAFSSLVGRGLRWGQVKTWNSLCLKVACIVTAYNLRFIDFTDFLATNNP